MIDELIVHIGPPKTSTTASQFAFTKSKDYLAAQGFFYEPDFGNFANHEIANFLRKTSIKELSDLPADELRQNPSFPALSMFGRQMISCEDLAGLRDQERVNCIIRWAEPKEITVVLAVREPTRWLWSLYQQKVRNQIGPEEGWTKFIEQSLADSTLFVSKMLEHWLCLLPAPKIVLIDQMVNPVVETPMIMAEALNIELASAAMREVRENLYNESLGLGESMLMPLFNQEVATELKSRQRVWGVIPEEFIKNVLLYQSSTAKVMYELGRELEKGGLSESDSLLDGGSLEALERFSSSWWDDFDQTLLRLSSLHQTHLPETNRTRPPVFSGYNLPIGSGFPVPEFERLIELPSEFFSLARVFASNIGLLLKTMNDSKSVEWLQGKN